MKKLLKLIFGGIVVSLMAASSISIASNRHTIIGASADPEHVEEACQNVDVGTLNDFVGYSASRDFSGTKDSVEVDNNGCFLFNDKHSNVEVAYRVSVMPTSHHVTFVQRSQQTVWGSYSRTTGYALEAYAHGVWQLTKLGTLMTNQVETYGIQANTNVWFRTVNCTDGSVHIKVDFSLDGFIGRTTIFDIYDTEDPIFDNSTNGCHGLFNDNGAGSVTISTIDNKVEDASPVSLMEISNPHGFNTGGATITNDEITINSPVNGGDTGVSFPINYTQSSISYNIDVTPTAKGTFDYSAFCFSIGSTKTEPSFPYPTQEGAGAWTSAGYIFLWVADGNGSVDIFVSRGIASQTWSGTRLSSTYIKLPVFALNNTSTVKVCLTELTSGFVRLTMYVAGELVLHFVDRPSDDGTTYTPLHMPSGQSFANVYMRSTSAGRLTPTNNGTISELNSWANTYLKMEDLNFVGDGEGKCKDENLYVDAKAQLLDLNELYVAAFKLNKYGLYDDAHDRYEAWATACGDTTPYAGVGIVANNVLSPIFANNNIIIVIIAVSAIAVIGLAAFYLAKKKHVRE